ncbi:MAG: hypothetical protein [Bacteriophage sp.]|nr:MAG: hypothetical protein [Bacteriophage sp.]
MTPILYEKDEIDFTSQGLGSLVEIYDVDVEEQRNGLLQFTASYPVSGVRYADISVGRIILAKPNQRDDVHAFRIVSTELDISGYAVTIEADSITYDLTHNLVKHLVASGNGQSFMTALKNAVVNPSIFAFYSDIATSSTTSLDYVNPMEAIMGTTGSFLQIWGGELKRENRRVAMFNRRGRDNVATFRLGKNISGLKYSVDISSLVTHIIPTKSVQNDDQTTTMLEGTPVDSQYINNYEQIYTLPLEFTDDTIKTVADLNAAAKGWFTQSANTGRDKPTVTIDIDVLSLQDSSDYQDKFKNLESVSLTDTVTVYVPEYGVNVTAIVNELHYDPILDRVTKMTVGTSKQSFADSSRTQLSDLQDKIISVQNQADATAVSANGKSTNYYGSVEPSHPQEGDTWFWVNGDKSGIKQFVNGDWVDLVDSDTQEKIAASVTEAVAQAKAHTGTAIEQNNASQQEVMNDIAKSQADLAIKDGDFNNKAQAMADKALSDAKYNTAQVAQDTLNSANQNLADAKKSVTDDIAREASDRASAVSALDTKATNAVNQAKSDINDTINALSVGDRNYILGTSTPIIQTSNGTDGQDLYGKANFYIPVSNWGISLSNYVISFDWSLSSPLLSDMGGKVIFNKSPYQNSSYVIPSNTLKGHVSLTINLWDSTKASGSDGLAFRIMSQIPSGETITYSNLYMKSGNIPTDWTPAPEDVVLDYTTKDNQIKATITQYQETNDGYVSKAQTDATTALGLVETKVSLTVYDQKTGELSSNINDVKDTADTSAQTISDIQEADGKRDSRISEVEKTAGEIKSTVSDLSTEQGKQSGYLSTLKQRADGFDATVTKVNGLSIGARNYWSLSGRTLGSYIEQDGTVKLSGTGLTAYNPNYFSVLPKQTIIVTLFDTDPNAPTVLAGRLAYYDKDKNFLSVSGNIPITKGSYKYVVPDNVAYFRMSLFKYDDIRTKVEIGTLATDWTPAPEDVDSATAKAQLTADNASAEISKLTSTDGVITKAQADIKLNADAISQKVSQTVYDQKTGDLTQAISKAQSTADGAVSTVGNYQTSNDKRVKEAESKIEQNSKDITARVTQTDYDKATGKLTGDISTLQQRADGFDATVTKVDNFSVGDRNYILDTANPKTQTSNGIDNQNLYGKAEFYSPIKNWGIANGDYIISFDWTLKTALSSDMQASVIFNASPWQVQNFTVKSGQTTSHVEFKFKLWGSILTTSSDITGLTFRIMSQMASGNTITYSNLFMKSGTISTTWTPAPEDAAIALSQVKVTADGVSTIVSDPNTGLSTRVQTAEGTLSTVKGTDIPALQNATFWQPYSSLNFNDYTKQGSFFFNTSSGKTNSPTTSNSWIYLIVEKGTTDGGRITQTAWYDTQTDAKITYRRQYAGTWGAWYANDNDSVTTISQTNSDVRQEISDRKTGDTNTLQSSKDFTSSQISNSESNMTSLINQKADSVIVGTIKDDVSSLKNNVNWQERDYDDINYLTENGNYLITGGSGTNGPFTPWYYIKVDAPRTDRITQTVWKDLYGTLMYRRTYDGSSWSPWAQMVMSSTLLSIFHDSWSLGTSTNDGITKQMITGIMGQPDGTLILKGNSLILDGNTTVTGDFYAKGGNFTNLNASNLTVGTLNGSQVNITNINANNIVSGAISGANLNINLNTGSVVFQKGRINSSDYTTDINIDQGYISTANGDTRAILKNGQLQLTSPNYYDLQTNPYLEISNRSGGFNGMAALVKARDSLTVSIDGYDERGFDLPPYEEDFVGLSIGKANNELMTTKIGGAEQGVIISGGKHFTSKDIVFSPYIYVGSDSNGSFPNGDRIYLRASYVHSPSTYLKTTSSSANVVVTLDGALVRASSARKYKLDIKNNIPMDDSLKLIEVPLSTWIDKHEHEENGSNERYFGMIAEDLRDAGLEYLVQYGEDNEVEGINYDRVALLLIPLVKELKERIEELESEGK